MSELEFSNVSVTFGRGRSKMAAVDGVSLTVPTGKVVGLVGESGSGKSTLGRAAVGLAPLAGGSISIDGAPVRRNYRRGETRPVQMVYQDPYSSLDPRMTVGASIAEGLSADVGRGKRSKAAEVDRLLELVNLDPSRTSLLPGRLSGGQRQRVALARALGSKSPFVIADEITSALDVSVQGAVLNLVRDVQQELNLGMLFITHNLAVVRYISDVVAVMYLGRIVEYGSTEQVLNDPQHPYTKQLLAAAPSRDGSLFDNYDGSAAAIAETPDPHSPPSGCRFHTRCAIGPMIRSDRDLCASEDPQGGSLGRVNRAACHFAPTVLTKTAG